MKVCFLFLLYCLLYAEVQGQTDSLGRSVRKYVIRNFPSVRTLDIQYEQNTTSDYSLKWRGKHFEKGTVGHLSKLKLSSTLPLYKTKRLTIYGNLRYSCYTFNADRPVIACADESPLFPDRTNDFHYWDISANATYRAQLFKKPVVYTVSVAGDGSERGFEKVKGVLVATLVVKRTPSTVISVGVIALLNTGAVYPVLPVFTFWHKFNYSPWVLDIGGPGYAYFRRSFTKKDRFSVGVAMNNEHFYLRMKNGLLPRTCYFSKNELKMGVVYEYQWGKHLCLTGRAGGITSFRSRLFDKKRINRKPYVEYTQHMNAFFNLGISYNL